MWGNGNMTPWVLNLVARWLCMVSCTCTQVSLWWKPCRYPMNKWDPVWILGSSENFLGPTGNRTIIPRFPFRSLSTYFGTTLTIKNSIREEIKCRLRSGNACYHSVQNLLSSMLLSKNLKIKVYKTIILPVVLYGVKLGRWHCGRKGSWGCLRTWCWGEYLDLGGTR